jgi:RimJ/RimL family protein N-acetyltransferase
MAQHLVNAGHPNLEGLIMMTLPIKTKRLHITEFDESMAESVHTNSLNADNRRFIPDEVFETVEEARETINALVSYYTQKDKPLVYPIILHDGRQIGHVQAIPVVDGWEVGYHIANPYTGNGYATEAVSAFLPPIMERLGITHICGICSAVNIASRRVLEKCGFLLKYEGAGILHKKEQAVCRYEKAHIMIRLITENKKDFLPLLLLGDEQESQIDKYLERGDMFALYDDNLKSICVVTDEGSGILEIQNLATDRRYQRKGYAARLVEYIAKHYAGRYDKIILGTGDVPGALAFYQHCGFITTHRVPDYFTTHYDHPIVEDGVLLKDKVYLERKLRSQ